MQDDRELKRLGLQGVLIQSLWSAATGPCKNKISHSFEPGIQDAVSIKQEEDSPSP